MSRTRREQDVEFECSCVCGAASYMVEGRFNASGEFEPTNVDEMGSDTDCPECGESGHPVDDDVRVADL